VTASGLLALPPYVRRFWKGLTVANTGHFAGLSVTRKETFNNFDTRGVLPGGPHQDQQPDDGEGPPHHVHEHPLVGHPQGGLQ
jgi:hypothetical protein